MKKPFQIELKPNCAETLRKSLLVSAPNEGCALLIGEYKLRKNDNEKYVVSTTMKTL